MKSVEFAKPYQSDDHEEMKGCERGRQCKGPKCDVRSATKSTVHLFPHAPKKSYIHCFPAAAFVHAGEPSRMLGFDVFRGSMYSYAPMKLPKAVFRLGYDLDLPATATRLSQHQCCSR